MQKLVVQKFHSAEWMKQKLAGWFIVIEHDSLNGSVGSRQ